MSVWTPEIIEHLRRLAGQAIGSSAIASELAATYGIRVTRSAVIGKCLRAKIELRRPISIKAARPPRPRKEPHICLPNSRPLKFAPRCEPIVQTEDEHGGPLGGGLTLIELHSGCCRWPFGDPRMAGLRYCGQPISDGAHLSFCGFHLQRATRAA